MNEKDFLNKLRCDDVIILSNVSDNIITWEKTFFEYFTIFSYVSEPIPDLKHKCIKSVLFEGIKEDAFFSEGEIINAKDLGARLSKLTDGHTFTFDIK